ncbi:MAG: hypothetical protein OEO23_12835 [Gemmatimonadota bacterium]|nr:hypothetical protein [Gemmatimonadota bacterium]
MCRILAVTAPGSFDVRPWLETFAARCRTSGEYQGDGWGIAWRTSDGWERYRSVGPIWSEGERSFPASTTFLVHARSAFRDTPVAVEHNMPFLDGQTAFAFNGELRGVRLAVPGVNGAARLFHLFGRLRETSSGASTAALERLDRAVVARTEYVRALNVVVVDEGGVHIRSRFGEDPDYFTLHACAEARGPGGERAAVVSSEAMTVPGADIHWQPVPNGGGLSLHPPGVGPGRRADPEPARTGYGKSVDPAQELPLPPHASASRRNTSC